MDVDHAKSSERFFRLLVGWTFVFDRRKSIFRRSDLCGGTDARLDIQQASGNDLSALDAASHRIHGTVSFASFQDALVRNLSSPRLLFRARAVELLRRREEEKLDSNRPLPNLRSNGVRGVDGPDHAIDPGQPDDVPATGAFQTILLSWHLSAGFRVEAPAPLSRLPGDPAMDREEAIVDHARGRGFELRRLHNFCIHLEP